MALPPIDMSAELEDEGMEDMPDDEMDEPLEDEPEADDGVDPMFAADISEAFPDLDDAQIAAIQRAVLGLIAGGGAPPAAPAAPMGF